MQSSSVVALSAAVQSDGAVEATSETATVLAQTARATAALFVSKSRLWQVVPSGGESAAEQEGACMTERDEDDDKEENEVEEQNDNDAEEGEEEEENDDDAEEDEDKENEEQDDDEGAEQDDDKEDEEED